MDSHFTPRRAGEPRRGIAPNLLSLVLLSQFLHVSTKAEFPCLISVSPLPPSLFLQQINMSKSSSS